MQEWRMDTNGVLALVGGSEWTPGCTFDAQLLATSGSPDVVVLPTASAYQHPERVVLQAADWFGTMGGQVEGLMVVDRDSANDPGMAAVVAGASFIYLSGGSPLHLKSVLKGSATFDALRQAWAGGAVVAASAAGAVVLTDPMVDPRGGGLTVGLGLIEQLAVMPEFSEELGGAHAQRLERTVALAPEGLPVVGIPDRTALIRAANGTWSCEGAHDPVVFLNGSRTQGLGALAG
jgi:cyanophycinase